MRIRDVILQDRLVQTVNARTWTFNINIVDPVTEFKIWFLAANNAVGPNEAGCIPYLVDNIEVIDGSEVIAAMNGPCAFALSCFEQGYAPLHWHQELGGMNQYWVMPITFGRSLEDPEWIFDPSKFKNPQMRITYNLAAVAAVGAGAYATAGAATPSISVWAKVMEEGARPRGYLMTKEVEEFTTALTGEHIIHLPTDYDIRKLLIRSYCQCGEMELAFDTLKLSQDQDKWVPWRLRGNDFIFLMKDWFEEVQLHLKHSMDNGEAREHYGGNYAHGLISSGTASYIATVRDWATNCFTADIQDDAGANMTDGIVWSMGMTRTPFDCWCYPFGNQDVAADWLKVAPMGNLRLILDQQTAGYLTQVVVQQAHPY